MNTERLHRLQVALEQILPILITEYKPEKIILFGSMVGGEVESWSDIDLLIVKETNQPFFRRLREVALLCRASVGIDFLVYTPQEVEAMLAAKNPFHVEVFLTGKVVYEREFAEAVA